MTAFAVLSSTGALAARANARLWKTASVTAISGPSLTVGSLNMAKETNLSSIARDFENSEPIRDADVLLLQEVSNNEKGNVAEELARKYHRHVIFSPAAPGVTNQGLAIVSKYPLGDVSLTKLKACNLRFRCRVRIGLAATAETPLGKVRVLNAHLDTRINSEERAEQLAPMIEEAERFNGPRLIGGDFNTNSMYWLGNVVPVPFVGMQSRGIRSALTSRGFSTPFENCGSTFPSFGQHLDWIFLKQLKSSAASTERMPFSDHHAIWTRVTL